MKFPLALLALSAATPAIADDDHPELFGSLKAFHDVMKVDWHGEPGAERNAAACKNVGNYINLSKDIGVQQGPSHADASRWKVASAGLVDASVALGAYCASAVDANVVAGLSTLHDRFHDLMALLRKPE